jgi:membrane fusion protein (multidrug efflux system)
VAEATVTGERTRARIGVRPVLIGAAALAITATVAYWALVLRGFERTNDAFVEGHLVFLSPRVGGQVAEVLVQENQHVRLGETLVRLDPADFEVRVARARADLDAAHNRIAQTRASADAAAAQVTAVEAKLRHAEQELGRARKLFANGVASRTALDAAVAAHDGASAELHAAREWRRERAALGNEAPVRQAEAMLREAELALAHSVVTALRRRGGAQERRSRRQRRTGPAALAVAEDAANWVTANFKETQIESMNAGDSAEIRVDATLTPFPRPRRIDLAGDRRQSRCCRPRTRRATSRRWCSGCRCGSRSRRRRRPREALRRSLGRRACPRPRRSHRARNPPARLTSREWLMIIGVMSR